MILPELHYAFTCNFIFDLTLNWHNECLQYHLSQTARAELIKTRLIIFVHCPDFGWFCRPFYLVISLLPSLFVCLFFAHNNLWSLSRVWVYLLPCWFAPSSCIPILGRGCLLNHGSVLCHQYALHCTPIIYSKVYRKILQHKLYKVYIRLHYSAAMCSTSCQYFAVHLCIGLQSDIRGGDADREMKEDDCAAETTRRMIVNTWYI